MWSAHSADTHVPPQLIFRGGCTVALSQGRFTYRHDQVLYCIVSNLSGLLAESQTTHVYADLPGMYASMSPQAIIPPSLIVTPYRPDIVIHNESTNTVVLLELTCPLDSIQHLESARDRKQTKEDYLQILSELDRLGTPCYYNTIEISVLGHYLQSSLSSVCNALNFIQQAIVISRSQCRKLLDEAAGLSVSSSRRIFLARNCAEWSVES